MARPLRIDYPGAWHHVMNRGRNHEVIFHDAPDFARFGHFLGRALAKAEVDVHSFALMNNHWHLLVKSVGGNISRTLQQLSAGYAQDFNRRHGLDGALCKGRFISRLIEDERYLLEAHRYIANNPVKAGLVTRPEHYKWSSYSATIGASTQDPFVCYDVVDEYFAGSADRFVAFVNERGSSSTDEYEHAISHRGGSNVLSQRLAEIHEAIDSVRAVGRTPGDRLWCNRVVDIVALSFNLAPAALADPQAAPHRRARAVLVAALHRGGIATQIDLGQAFGLASTTVRRLIRQVERQALVDDKVSDVLERVRWVNSGAA